ncbi:hypothetical protein [Brevibacillus borstelensis]|uniref:hypothetical protein n=1 Tax=Brevibacillus borstelensis TaxID=45462 RepID=UPI0030BD7BBE
MAEEIKQDIQTIHIPATGETIEAKTYTGKELFLREDTDEKGEEYAKQWEDDRL